jgi:hypothetical protein
MNKPYLNYQLVLNVSIDPHGTTPDELQRVLHEVVQDAVNNGTLTGETEATVEHYDYSVKLKRYPKKVVIDHARKMNTKPNAKKMAWLDIRPYITTPPRSVKS